MAKKKYITHDEIRETIDAALTEILIVRDLLNEEGRYESDFDVDHSYKAWDRLDTPRNSLKMLREKLDHFEVVKEEPKTIAED